MTKSKEKIIEVATELFHKNGFNQTAVDEILEKSGVTKSNFYYHFTSKEELGLKVLDRRIKQFEAEVISANLEDALFSPQERLSNLYERVTKYHRNLKCSCGCPFGNLALEMSDVNEKFRGRLSAFFMRWEKAIETCIQDGIDCGEFRGDVNPTLVAGLILTQLEGAIMMVKTYKTIDPLLTGTQTVLQLLRAA